MWSDNETDADLINVQHLVGTVTSLVSNKAILPLTIGVFGAWGSGKSSVMKMTQEAFKGQPGVLCIPFNGWLFEGNEDAKSALMGSILDELQSKLPITEKAKALLLKLTKRVDWLRLMGLAGKQIISLSVSGMPHFGGVADAFDFVKDTAKGFSVEEAKELVRESPDKNVRQTVREFRKDFAELLELSTVDTLVVLIDDLDRCLPDTIIETLEAIKLFLYVPGTAFIIGADERLVQHAVKRRFPEIGDDAASSAHEKFDLGRDYLEKLVQVPVRIPPLGQAEVETYINLLFAQLRLTPAEFAKLNAAVVKKAGLSVATTADLSLTTITQFLPTPPSELVEDLTLSQQTADVLTRILRGNPRQIKRFLNTMLLRVSMAKIKQVDLKRRVMAKLMLLEEFKPNLFGVLAQWQAEANGTPPELEALERVLRQQDVPAAPAEKLSDSVPGITPPASGSELPPLPTRAQSWAEDEWLRIWLQSEPSLAAENLAPYFYVARDKIGVLRGSSLRLSQEAGRVLALLLSPSQAERQNAIAPAAALTEEDASTLVKALAERSRRSEDLGQEGSPLLAMLELAKAKRTTATEVMAFIDSLPVKGLPIRIPVQLRSLSETVPAVQRSVAELLTRWAGNAENAPLAQASKRAMSADVITNRQGKSRS
jgi:predicted KAP-like P-loop ATPase